MKRRTCIRTLAVAAFVVSVAAGDAGAQSTQADDPVLEAIRTEGMERSQLEALAHVLLDSIGPRLTGSPGERVGREWLIRTYRSWGIDARNEQYGTWRGWRRGPTHVDLLEPRVRTLGAMALAWSPPTDGPLRAEAVLLPRAQEADGFHPWLDSVRGKFVLIDFPQPTCRPAEPSPRWGAETVEPRRERMAAAAADWEARLRATDPSATPSSSARASDELIHALDSAGVAGILTSRWSEGWGVNRIFDAKSRGAPTVDLSCEDYGLVARLAESGSRPVMRVDVQAEDLGEVPVFNTIAVIPGSELPNEYVILSAHFDSWDGASGATDNGAGTLMMMEAMRMLRAAYPKPRRTIIAGHWSGEEQGLNGSRAFTEDHPEIVAGLQILLNQDNGTGPIHRITMQRFSGAGAFFSRWLERVPEEIRTGVQISAPEQASGGSDHMPFVCHGATAFVLGSLGGDYFTYTWHTNLDTYDKVVFEALRRNAVLTAMLAYLAAADPDRVPRDRLMLPPDASGQPQWYPCTPASRSWR